MRTSPWSTSPAGFMVTTVPPVKSRSKALQSSWHDGACRHRPGPEGAADTMKGSDVAFGTDRVSGRRRGRPRPSFLEKGLGEGERQELSEAVRGLFSGRGPSADLKLGGGELRHPLA